MEPARVLREARQAAALSQVELAERCATSQATVSAYENGHKTPSVATFSRLLAATGRRLTVVPATAAVRTPTASELAERGRILAQVIDLAERLPSRRSRALRYPRLDSASG